MSTLIEAPIEIPKVEKADESIVFVTGLWDIGRDALKEGWSRGYQHYLNRFEELLKTPYNLIVYGDDNLETYVFQRRSIINTQFIKRDPSFFVKTEFYDQIQKIRQDPEWFEQAGWLKDSTQAKLELYNPLVTSKMFLLNDARLLSKFKSEYMFWIDAGLSNTVHWGYFNETSTINRLKKYFNKFSFICFPYEASNEIHGFKFPDICRIAGDKVKLVGRGGFFGGPTESISSVNSLYYGLLKSTLFDGLMGTEESIFSILVYKHADMINYFEIEGNGLISAFFEGLKNDTLKIKNKLPEAQINSTLNTDNVGLYVITFNSPNQFRTLIKSMELYDKNFLTKPKKFLLDNSKDEKTFDEYAALCKEHDFVHIKKDNLGICGGRQFIAEHSDEQGFDFHFFFEDDMFFYSGENIVCKNGFVRKVTDLYNKSIDIARLYNLDFLKLSFTEFFGDNSIQWAWYNVPQTVRERVWPNKCTLPEKGIDPNAPKTKFDSILSYKNLAFATGDVYYSNWPQVVTKHGNKKMFLETKWAHPYEQTWMSYIFQKKQEGEINGGLLLATPTEHDRFEHYDRSERREN